MKRGKVLLAAVAVAAAAFGMSPVRATSTATCTPSAGGSVGSPVSKQGYLYCGYRWVDDALPLQVKIVTANLPQNGLTSGILTSATQAAIATWNQAWPSAVRGKKTISGCSQTAPLCFKGIGTGLNSTDGVTTIVVGSGLPAGKVGRTYVTSNSNKEIMDADVLLNAAIPWRAAAGADLVTGEVPGVAGRCPASLGSTVCKTWNDVQNVLTHELGHVLGLEDLVNAFDENGNPVCWPTDLTGAENNRQTMSACIWPGDTGKRTLEWGDVLGIQRVAVGTTM